MYNPDTNKWIAYDIIEKGNGSVTIVNSFDKCINSNNPKELLEFLYTPYRNEANREFKFFWDIDESMSMIFKLLTPEQCNGILSTKDGGDYQLFDYKVSYSRERNFVIRGNKSIGSREYWCCLYSIGQFLKHDSKPEKVNDIFKQGLRVKQALVNIGLDNTKTLSSPVKIYESAYSKTSGLMINNILKTLPVDKIDVVDFAERCSQRQGFIANYSVGSFKESEITEYDISSCYPYWLSQMRDFTKIEITRYDKDYKYKTGVFSGDVTGYFDCELTINDDVKVHPFAYKQDNDELIYPVGKFKTSLVLEEMMAFVKYKLGTIKVLDGYYVRFLTKGKPFNKTTNDFFNLRERGEVEDIMVKGVLVQTIGKSLRVDDKGKPSEHYNPLAVGWIYAKARLQVFDFIMSNGLVDYVQAISTDSVLTTKQVKEECINTGKKVLGTWRKKENIPAIILSAGYIMYDKKHQNSLYYRDAIKMMSERPNEMIYKYTFKKRITLYEALENHKDITLVGNITDEDRSLNLLNIRSEQRRIYRDFPMCGGELISGKIYKSKPIRI